MTIASNMIRYLICVQTKTDYLKNYFKMTLKVKEKGEEPFLDGINRLSQDHSELSRVTLWSVIQKHKNDLNFTESILGHVSLQRDQSQRKHSHLQICLGCAANDI